MGLFRRPIFFITTTLSIAYFFSTYEVIAAPTSDLSDEEKPYDQYDLPLPLGDNDDEIDDVATRIQHDSDCSSHSHQPNSSKEGLEKLVSSNLLPRIVEEISQYIDEVITKHIKSSFESRAQLFIKDDSSPKETKNHFKKDVDFIARSLILLDVIQELYPTGEKNGFNPSAQEIRHLLDSFRFNNNDQTDCQIKDNVSSLLNEFQRFIDKLKNTSKDNQLSNDRDRGHGPEKSKIGTTSRPGISQGHGDRPDKVDSGTPSKSGTSNDHSYRPQGSTSRPGSTKDQSHGPEKPKIGTTSKPGTSKGHDDRPDKVDSGKPSKSGTNNDQSYRPVGSASKPGLKKDQGHRSDKSETRTTSRPVTSKGDRPNGFENGTPSKSDIKNGHSYRPEGSASKPGSTKDHGHGPDKSKIGTTSRPRTSKGDQPNGFDNGTPSKSGTKNDLSHRPGGSTSKPGSTKDQGHGPDKSKIGTTSRPRTSKGDQPNGFDNGTPSKSGTKNDHSYRPEGSASKPDKSKIGSTPKPGTIKNQSWHHDGSNYGSTLRPSSTKDYGLGPEKSKIGTTSRPGTTKDHSWGSEGPNFGSTSRPGTTKYHGQGPDKSEIGTDTNTAYGSKDANYRITTSRPGRYKDQNLGFEQSNLHSTHTSNSQWQLQQDRITENEDQEQELRKKTISKTDKIHGQEPFTYHSEAWSESEHGEMENGQVKSSVYSSTQQETSVDENGNSIFYIKKVRPTKFYLPANMPIISSSVQPIVEGKNDDKSVFSLAWQKLSTVPKYYLGKFSNMLKQRLKKESEYNRELSGAYFENSSQQVKDQHVSFTKQMSEPSQHRYQEYNSGGSVEQAHTMMNKESEEMFRSKLNQQIMKESSHYSFDSSSSSGLKQTAINVKGSRSNSAEIGAPVSPNESSQENKSIPSEDEEKEAIMRFIETATSFLKGVGYEVYKPSMEGLTIEEISAHIIRFINMLDANPPSKNFQIPQDIIRDSCAFLRQLIRDGKVPLPQTRHLSFIGNGHIVEMKDGRYVNIPISALPMRPRHFEPEYK